MSTGAHQDELSTVDSEVAAVVDDLVDRELSPHSFLVTRGQLIYERHWWPHRPDLLHMLHSATKSFVGTAVGIAIDEGRLSLDDAVLDLIARRHRTQVPRDSRLHAVRLEDALTMRTGHATGISGSAWRRRRSSWIDGYVRQPVEHASGERFTYSSGTTQLLSAIISHVTGESVESYLRPRLFEALDIDTWSWDTDPDGYSTGGNGLSLRPADFLKWGQLHLQRGAWEGEQVIGRGWVEAATSRHVLSARAGRYDDGRFVPDAGHGDVGYGYQIWTHEDGAFAASGMFGQECVVLPKHGAVVVMTAGIGGFRHRQLPELLVTRLNSALARSTSRETPPETSAPPPAGPEWSEEQWAAVDGRTYAVAEPGADLDSVRFDRTARDRLTVTLTDARGTHAVTCGAGGWAESRSSVTTWFLHHAYQHDEALIVASARWADDHALRLTWNFVESPFCDTVVVHFDNHHINWTRSVSANSGPPDRPAIVLVESPVRPD